MPLTDITARAAPLAQSLLEEDEVKRRLRSAAGAGLGAVRSARGKKQETTRMAALTRAGVAVRETGRAVIALSSGAEKRRTRQKQRNIAPAAVLAVGTAAAAAVLASRSSDSTTPKEDTNG